MKDGTVLGPEESPQALASQEDMEKINRYTRRPYGPEEVFVFPMVLCDNQVDRDGERFSAQALEQLAQLFLGKTCLFDHDRRSANQAARIFDTALQREPHQLTQAGEPLVKLTARAYLPRTKGTEELIALIDSGMLKEVSVSCKMKRRVCSLCGQESCGHEPGTVVDGHKVHRVLEEPEDAYECSFVAVPAQPGAGVTKRAREESVPGQTEKRWQALEEEAAWGRRYRESLTGQVLKYSAILQPELPRGIMEAAVKGLSMGDLEQMGRTYEHMAQKALPLSPQLAPREDQAQSPLHGEFRI